MTRQDELGKIISNLNEYFKAERERISADYDKILYQLSAELRQNQQYIPSEFTEKVSELFSDFPDQQKTIESVTFVPYAKQIPTYKFEMVEYLCNASIMYGLREYAMRTMIEDLQRLQEIPGNYYNFHPGSHVSQGTEKGMEKALHVYTVI